MSVTKGSEFTYGVHGRSLLGLIKDNQATIMTHGIAETFLERMDGMVMGSVRKLNDQFELLRQGIAYTLPFKIDDDGEILFLVYKRTKHNSEGRLAEKLSLAPGGHIEGRDLSYYPQPTEDGKSAQSDTINWSKTLQTNLMRELCEEVKFHSKQFEHTGRDLGILAASNAKPIGFVMDSKPEMGFVGNTHFGAIYAANVPSDTVFLMKEKCNTSVDWVSADRLVAHVNGHNALVKNEDGPVKFEPWSEMIIKNIVQVSFAIRDAFNTERSLDHEQA